MQQSPGNARAPALPQPSPHLAMHEDTSSRTHPLLDEGEGGREVWQQGIALVINQGDDQMGAAAKVAGHVEIDSALRRQSPREGSHGAINRSVHA